MRLSLMNGFVHVALGGYEGGRGCYAYHWVILHHIVGLLTDHREKGNICPGAAWAVIFPHLVWKQL